MNGSRFLLSTPQHRPIMSWKQASGSRNRKGCHRLKGMPWANSAGCCCWGMKWLGSFDLAVFRRPSWYQREDYKKEEDGTASCGTQWPPGCSKNAVSSRSRVNIIDGDLSNLLHLAIEHGRNDRLAGDLLLAREYEDIKDASGRFLIHLAAPRGLDQVERLFLLKGVNVNS